jgi:hypothetical protein
LSSEYLGWHSPICRACPLLPVFARTPEYLGCHSPLSRAWPLSPVFTPTSHSTMLEYLGCHSPLSRAWSLSPVFIPTSYSTMLHSALFPHNIQQFHQDYAIPSRRFSRLHLCSLMLLVQIHILAADFFTPARRASSLEGRRMHRRTCEPVISLDAGTAAHFSPSPYPLVNTYHSALFSHNIQQFHQDYAIPSRRFSRHRPQPTSAPALPLPLHGSSASNAESSLVPSRTRVLPTAPRVAFAREGLRCRACLGIMWE